MCESLPNKRFLFVGDVVRGAGFYCPRAHPKKPGGRCGGYVGGAPEGWALYLVEPPVTGPTPSFPDLCTITCSTCRRRYIFAARKAA